jgi:hypothetical protein
MTGKFKREFANEAVFNDSDYLWGQPTFRCPLRIPDK